ncbi:DUF3043 domain-containing protein [Rhodococcus sp. D2-41]|uniref:DUF3043 domain-containing protein n=1 Tax=Speluncibacter jeojiensis TaxID=2710754 RepID=A0A9X4RFW4_9ACTN|nr:DUF3043 domain-containing protein [Rhodococcus sp. D2-41]MDG3011935.1 DUF3043 domain-containing protein [Rhodococcus sp. D2-41]MDG3013386.1 DUF3043 domain-containing protein [Corynebacteriales bacterium D3-21]
MKLLRRGSQDEPDETGVSQNDEDAVEESSTAARPAQTAKKGKPTPKRRDAEGRRGPVAPAPQTSKEARARRRSNRGTKEERKEAGAERRAVMSDRRSRMMAGEEAFLLPRDKGPARGYTRDLVDSRRHLLGLFMPMAIVLVLALFLAPGIQAVLSLVMLVFIVFMAIEGIVMARQIYNKVLARYPDTTERPISLGWYAFVRASQLRRMRAPRPRLSPGDPV